MIPVRVQFWCKRLHYIGAMDKKQVDCVYMLDEVSGKLPACYIH